MGVFFLSLSLSFFFFFFMKMVAVCCFNRKIISFLHQLIAPLIQFIFSLTQFKDWRLNDGHHWLFQVSNFQAKLELVQVARHKKTIRAITAIDFNRSNNTSPECKNQCHIHFKFKFPSLFRVFLLAVGHQVVGPSDANEWLPAATQQQTTRRKKPPK